MRSILIILDFTYAKMYMGSVDISLKNRCKNINYN